jgi:hypothetical protein
VTDAPAHVQDLPFGFTWTQDEPMARASHVLAEDGRVWIVDPVDSPGVVERAQALGEVVAVVQLLDRHNRDCAVIAARLGVAHLKVPSEVRDSPFEVVRVVHWPKWAENALWWPAQRALVVAEAVGTAPLFTLGTGPVGVHAMLRPVPPRKALGGFAPDHLLVGHGPAVDGDDARDGLRRALDGARRDLPRLFVQLPKLLRSGS